MTTKSKHYQQVIVLILTTFYRSDFCDGANTRNNVCKTIKDYHTASFNPNCWYNPDVGATPKEIITRYGFPFESHQVQSEDGYIVTLFRVPHGAKSDKKGPPVLLQHGIAVDSRSWIARGAQSSVFILANNGFDVWLGNARGTEYSSQHSNYTTFDKAYWDFGFHEIGVFEISAVIDYIVKQTNQKVTYVGHSMGTTEAFIYASLKPNHAEANVKRIIALAPVATLRNLRSILFALVPFRQAIKIFSEKVGFHGIGSNVQGFLDIFHHSCSRHPFLGICNLLLALGGGINPREIVVEDLPIYLNVYLQGFSLISLDHYAQIMERKGRLQFYDYGRTKNRLLYGSSEPPDYPISQIKIPIDLIYGNNDFLAEPENVVNLYKRLNTKKTIRQFRDYSHQDFQTGRTLPELFKLVIELIK